jgi:hypothetical protein
MIDTYKSKIENTLVDETYQMLLEERYLELKKEYEVAKNHVKESELNYEKAKKKMNKKSSIKEKERNFKRKRGEDEYGDMAIKSQCTNEVVIDGNAIIDVINDENSDMNEFES